jgi:hypothetical protein
MLIVSAAIFHAAELGKSRCARHFLAMKTT